MCSAITTPLPNSTPPTEPLSETPLRLFDLPAELRLQIYEIIFTNEAEVHQHPIDLRTARPPLHLPLLACRQFYNEALQIYEKAHRTYWSSHAFYLYMTTTSLLTQTYITGLKETDLQHIKQFELILVPDGTYFLKDIKLWMVDPCGLWQAACTTKSSPDVPQRQRYVFWRKNKDIDVTPHGCQNAVLYHRAVQAGFKGYDAVPTAYQIRQILSDLTTAWTEGVEQGEYR